MEIELLAIGMNGAAAALLVGCIALIRATLKNLDTNRELSNDSKSEKKNNPRTEVIHSRTLLDYSASEFRSISGNIALLRELNLPNDLDPTLLAGGDRLSAMAANIGFSNFEIITRALAKENPSLKPFFFGINRGGALMANLLSQRLNLDQKYLVRCDYRPEWSKVICEPRPSVELAIIIDDAVRTGETMSAVKLFLKNKYPNAKIYAFALVISAFEMTSKLSRNDKLFGLVDYYPWVSLSRRTALPWSDEDSDDATDFIDQDGIDQMVGRLLSHNASGEAGPDRPDDALLKEH